MATFHTAQLQNFTLAGSGVALGDTTIVLTSFKDIDGNNLAIADFGSKGYGTAEPGSSDREEQISFTGVTQNANGTATLTGVKNVEFLTPYTETSGFSKSHPGGVTFVISNTSGFYSNLPAKDNNEVIAGFWQAPDPLAAQGIATKAYVDNLVNGGDVSTNALIVVGTAGETVAAGKIVYLNSADGRWWLASSASAATTDNIQLGIAQGAGTAGNVISGGVLIAGNDANQSGLTPGTAYFLSTSGDISASPGANVRIVGQAVTATSLNLNSVYSYVPTSGQKSALASTTIPSSTNLYMTQSDEQKAAVVYAADAGANDTYVITLSPAPAAYTTGMTVRFKANTANTGTATLNVNSLGAITIKKNVSSDLSTGDILANQIISVIYDGTNFQLLSSSSNSLSLISTGQTTWSMGDANGTQNIPHGLGVTPRLVKVTLIQASSGQTQASTAFGTYSGGSAKEMNIRVDTAGTNNTTANNMTLYFDGSNTSTASLSAPDSTNINIAWTKSGSPAGTVRILWEALA